MAFFSKSSKSNHYRKGTYGRGRYQQKGLFGNLLNMMGSGSGSSGHHRGNYYNQPGSMKNQPLENQNSPTCSKCSARIPSGSKFCLQCGEKVVAALFCTNCGEKLPSNAKFCLNCGTKL